MSFPIGIGFWKQGADDVCTPYNVALPYSTNLIAHSSLYNICDIFQLNDQTLPLSDEPDPDGLRCAWFSDLSESSNPFIDASSVPSAERSFIYKNDGSVFGLADSSLPSGPGYRVNNSWRWNTDVKTMILLCQVDNVASSASTRFQQTQFQIRFLSSNLSVFDGANRNSSLTGTSNNWQIISCRTDNNIVLGLNKNYEEVKSTPPVVANVDFIPFITSNPSNKFLGKFREILIFSESISDANLDDISDWLTDKWNL